MFSVHSLKFVKCGLNSPPLDKFILLCSCLRTDGADGSRHKLVPPSLFHYSTAKTLIILLQSACYPLGHQKQTHRHSKPQEKEILSNKKEKCRRCREKIKNSAAVGGLGAAACSRSPCYAGLTADYYVFQACYSVL